MAESEPLTFGVYGSCELYVGLFSVLSFASCNVIAPEAVSENPLERSICVPNVRSSPFALTFPKLTIFQM